MVHQVGEQKAMVPNGASLRDVGQEVRVPKMAELIARNLRRQIVRGDVVEGEALPAEAELMAQFDVSRPTLREAFRILESESLIRVRRGARGGARVQVPDPAVAARYAALVLEYRGTTLEDLYEARIVIEPPSVALLAKRRTPGAVRQLQEALDEHEAVADDPIRSIHTHIAFHSLLIELTGNKTLRLLMRLLEDIIDMANTTQVESTLGSPAHALATRKGTAAHHRIVDLIADRDVSGAQQLWQKHLTEARDYLIRPDIKTVLDLMG